MIQALFLSTLPLVFALPAEAAIESGATPRPRTAPNAGLSEAPQDPPQEEGKKKPGLADRARARRAQPEGKTTTSELRRADGTLVVPGELPGTATKTARNTWIALTDALATEGSMDSFALDFHLRQHSPETTQSNDLSLEFAYLAPRYVYAKLESGRTLYRGDAGDYLVDGKEVIKLQGREAAADKKTLDEMAAIAATFVALTAPASLRLVDLTMLEKAPAGIHPRYHGEMKSFLWMRVTSPDFFLFSTKRSKATRVYEADLGIDPQTKAIRFAVIRDTAADPQEPPSTIFVRMSDHERREGFFVPHLIEICNLDPNTEPPRFHKRPTSRLHLKRKTGRLRMGLTPEDFVPPTR